LQEQASLQSLEVFAFLPLRSYGFRFLVQADWIVPSAREAVDHSSEWNDWLRSLIPDLFIRAVKIMIQQACRILNHRSILQKSDGSEDSEDELVHDTEASSTVSLVGDEPTRANSILLLNNLYAVIPATGELMEYFHKTADEIFTLLSDTRLILTDQGKFVVPSEAVLRPTDESAVRRTEGFLSRLGLQFVAADVSLPTRIASTLQVRLWDAKLLVDILSEALRSFAEKRADESGKDIFNERLDFIAWALGAILQQGQLSKSRQLERLQKLPCIPLTTGELSSISEVMHTTLNTFLLVELRMHLTHFLFCARPGIIELACRGSL
jgi:hypothetical protein